MEKLRDLAIGHGLGLDPNGLLGSGSEIDDEITQRSVVGVNILSQLLTDPRNLLQEGVVLVAGRCHHGNGSNQLMQFLGFHAKSV